MSGKTFLTDGDLPTEKLPNMVGIIQQLVQTFVRDRYIPGYA